MVRRQESDLDERIIQINRVSRKTKGGNKISFSVLTVAGDRRGRVGIGLGKANDVTGAIQKSLRRARRVMIEVPLKGTTIPHLVQIKYKAAKLLLKPAPPGTGVIAGSPVRAVVEAAGVRDIVSKILGTNNKITNVKAAIKALGELRHPDQKVFFRAKPKSVPEPTVAKPKGFLKTKAVKKAKSKTKSGKKTVKKNGGT